MTLDLIPSRRTHTIHPVNTILSLECGEYIFDVHHAEMQGGNFLMLRVASLDLSGEIFKNVYRTILDQANWLNSPLNSTEQQRVILENLTSGGTRWPNTVGAEIQEDAAKALDTLRAYYESVKLRAEYGVGPSMRKKSGPGTL